MTAPSTGSFQNIKLKLCWQCILEHVVFSLDFGRFVLEWQLSRFCCGRSIFLGFWNSRPKSGDCNKILPSRSHIPGILAHSSPNIGHCHTVGLLGGACSLGFGTVKATILVTVVILTRLFRGMCVEQVYSRTPCTGLVWINQ